MHYFISDFTWNKQIYFCVHPFDGRKLIVHNFAYFLWLFWAVLGILNKYFGINLKKYR